MHVHMLCSMVPKLETSQETDNSLTLTKQKHAMQQSVRAAALIIGCCSYPLQYSHVMKYLAKISVCLTKDLPHTFVACAVAGSRGCQLSDEIQPDV